MIDDCKNGFLVQPFNSHELSDRILYYLEHPSAASEMALMARKVIEERFDWRIIVKKVLKVYDEALG